MKKIALASILKPVNEVRMYKRFSYSLLKTNIYEINIIGIRPKKNIEVRNLLSFQYLTNSRRNPLIRIFNQFQTAYYILKIKPDLLIITSPELILLAIILKKILGLKLIYDIQEDYVKNITFQRIYRGVTRNFLIKIIALFNQLANKHFDHFILAEKIYVQDLSFITLPSLLLENKAVPINSNQALNSHNFRILFSGTLSQYSGVFQAIEFYQKFKLRSPNVSLLIVGYASQKLVANQIKRIAKKEDKITCIGIDHFVEHEVIQEAITNADLGIISYLINEVSKDKVPTKLYEYSNYQLPYVVQENTFWSEIGTRLGGAIAINFNKPDFKKIENFVTNKSLLFENTDNTDSSWKKEETKLLKLIDDTINKK